MFIPNAVSLYLAAVSHCNFIFKKMAPLFVHLPDKKT